MLITRRWSRRLPIRVQHCCARYLATAYQPFTYAPLQSEGAFRLLQLHRSEKPDDEVRCTLRHASLDDSPMYEALSYVWGERRADDPEIIVNGQTLRVTQNLFSALKRLRTQERTIWVDAISINQDDHTERTGQVLQMRRIFGQSSRTLAWLGEQNEMFDNAFSHVKRLHAAVEAFQEREDVLDDVQSADNFVHEYMYSLLDPSQHAELVRYCDGDMAIQSLLENSWFQRIWIVQEVAVSPRVFLVAGSLELEWSVFEAELNFNRLIRKHEPQRPSPGLQRALILQTIRSDVQEGFGISEGSTSLLSYLVALRSFDSSDPRDKSFAIAGLVGESEVAELAPNYSPENTTQHVYQKIALYYLRQTQDLSILHHAGCDDGNQMDQRLPSWVPDWRQKRTIMLQQPVRDAAAGTSASFALSTDEMILQVRGRVVDSLATIGAHAPPDTDINLDARLRSFITPGLDSVAAARIVAEFQRPFRPFVCDFVDNVFARYKDNRHYISGGRLEEAVLHTLLWVPQDIAAAIDYFSDKGFTKESLLASLRFLPEHEEASHADVFAAFAQITGYMLFRNWCITSKGYLGRPPPSAKEGDVVAVMDGLDVPLVLRRVQGQQFRLIGECYIHGIMNGEAIRDDTIAPQIIELV